MFEAMLVTKFLKSCYFVAYCFGSFLLSHIVVCYNSYDKRKQIQARICFVFNRRGGTGEKCKCLY